MARYLGGGRGLQLYTEFRDHDGSIVRLADSSLATKRACRLHVRVPAFNGAEPHLTIAQAKLLRNALTRFIGDAR